MNGVERIAAERKRQIEEEGFTARHDSGNDHNEMALAAVCYALPEAIRNQKVSRKDNYFRSFLRHFWPWDEEWWKPSPDNRIRELEKAGALIAAEIDRLLRLENKREEQE
jgi:hypothetical protein